MFDKKQKSEEEQLLDLKKAKSLTQSDLNFMIEDE